MKNNRPVFVFLTLVLVISLAGCNLPSARPADTATPTATQIPPSPTPLPPTATAAPPTEMPTQEPPTPTKVQPTMVFPTKAPTNTPTPVVIKPAARARFDGTYDYGTFVFRIGDNPAYVVPKSITVKSAPCNEGKNRKKSDTLTLDPPTFYQVIANRFSINFGDSVIISGEFITPVKARGTLTLKLKVDGKACTIGPYAWSATGQ
jgi:hypothetical protein